VPPGCTVFDAVVSETGGTQAHAMLAGTIAASTAIMPSVKRRHERLISLFLVRDGPSLSNVPARETDLA